MAGQASSTVIRRLNRFTGSAASAPMAVFVRQSRAMPPQPSVTGPAHGHASSVRTAKAVTIMPDT
jgi:hypothetical protein